MFAISVFVLGAIWAGAYYFGPSLLKTSKGPESTTRPPDGNQTDSTSTEIANVLVDFGNGTRLWSNTTVPRDWNYYNITYKVTNGDLSARWFDYPIQSHFVYKIMGFGCDPDQIGCNGYWSLWLWNDSGQCWAYSHLGVDLVKVTDVRMVSWHFTNFESTSEPERRC